MARAGVASASARSDSIQGLAQSIAKPAYRRLLTAEPLLRRAVPVLIIAFLATICVGAAVQVLDHRQQALSDRIVVLEAAASPERQIPDYLTVDHKQMKGTFVRGPKLGDVPYPVQMEPNLVVEFYSR